MKELWDRVYPYLIIIAVYIGFMALAGFLIYTCGAYRSHFIEENR